MSGYFLHRGAAIGSLMGAVIVAMICQAATTVHAADVMRLEIEPQGILLTGPRSESQLVITGTDAAGHQQDLTGSAEVLSTNEAVAKIAGTRVTPAGEGSAEIVIRAAGLETKVPVQVSTGSVPHRTSFQYDALAALSKQGCNSGACHGSPSGKGGFRLSLRAYDPTIDEYTLIREWYNRRTNLIDAEQSLLLLKPLMKVFHGGGQKLRKSDLAYELLRDWIDEGCPLDSAEQPKLVGLEIYPKSRTLHAPHFYQQLRATANFSDGAQRDVTRLTVFSSSDETVASVDELGKVNGVGRGESVVLARYLDQMATSSLLFLSEVPGFAWNNPPEQNYVDQHVFAKLRQLQILPSELCDDGEFLRRVQLDVTGQLPSAEQAQAFLADTDTAKRARLIDRLLESPEYVNLWAMKWADLLRVRNARVTPGGVYKFHHWLVAAVQNNTPYDQFARQLLTATGSTFVNPPANYFRAAADTEDCAETTSQLFLGIRISCAKCHNHPFERWTQDNYYGIAAFFKRVGRKPGPTPEEQIVWLESGGEVTQPRTGKQMQPWLPLSGSIDLPGEVDRRQAFVEWLTKPENPFFAKVAVNRLWAHLMGRGIVEPVDDFRDSNPPASAELLAALATDFVQHGYDCKHVLRTILNSRTYQLSSRVNAFNTIDVKYFSHAQPRLVPAEQMLDAICSVTGTTEKFAGLPAGTHATAVPSPDSGHEFMQVFGQPARETVCACERSSDANLSQALQMINGPLVHAKVKHGENRIRKLLAAGRSNPEIVTELYLAAFCRPPNETELATATTHIEKSADRTLALEDICWALLNSNEFLFQH